MNFCTNSAFPQVTNRNNNNNDENSATNSGQNEQCKTFVGTPINIDMKCLDEFSVINLSDYSLNRTDLRLLSKGLTFTPTPDVANIGEIKSDLDSFLRKIRLRLYFSEEISEDEPSLSSSPTQTQVPEFEDTLIRKFRNKSNWSPKNQDAQVETYIRTVITEFQKLKLRNPPKTNLTQEEKQRLNLLQNNQHIVVKPADKGSAIVIMNRTDYITEATRQLSDTKFYTKTQVDLNGTHNNKITQTLSTMLRNDEIAQSVYRNLVPKDCKTPAFYFLPTIHKQKITGRPIISGNNCPTEKISAFIDEHIKQFVPHIKSYVRDTPDFIKKIENFKLTGDYFLVTMDVTSLYTNIPNHEGLAVRAFRRSPNLRDHLVKAALKSNTPKTTPYPQQYCAKQDCQTCKLIKRRDKLPQNSREYKLAKDVNCQTNNVVYLLECTRCKKQYIGETKRNFLTRFKEHLADIRHNRDTPVAKHFNLNSHKTAATQAQPIPTILSRIAGHPDRTTDVRKNKEKMWIHTLRSTAPHGINVRE